VQFFTPDGTPIASSGSATAASTHGLTCKGSYEDCPSICAGIQFCTHTLVSKQRPTSNSAAASLSEWPCCVEGSC
jgi:hypothetical protein